MTEELKKVLFIGSAFLLVFFLGLFLGVSTHKKEEKLKEVKQSKIILEKNQAEDVIQDFIRLYYTDDNAIHPQKLKEYVTDGFYQQIKANAKKLKEANYYDSVKSAKVKHVALYFGNTDDTVICRVTLKKVFQREQSKNTDVIEVEDKQNILLHYQINEKGTVQIDNLSTLQLQVIQEGRNFDGKED